MCKRMRACVRARACVCVCVLAFGLSTKPKNMVIVLHICFSFPLDIFSQSDVDILYY